MIASIDTGEKGAIAIFDSNLNLLQLHDMPMLDPINYTEARKKKKFKLVDIAKLVAILDGVHEVAIEHIRGYRGQTTLDTMRQQGSTYGAALYACAAVGADMHLLDPKQWMSAVGVYGSGTKNAAWHKAVSIYPKAELTGKRGGKLDGRSDAIMIGLAAVKLNLM